MTSIIFDPPTRVAADLAAASRFTLMLSSAAAAFLPLLPLARPSVGGTDLFPSPATVSGRIPSAYHAFMVSVIFAFTCSFSAVFLESKHPAARILRLTAIAWLSSAMILFLYTAVFDRLA